MSQSKRPIWGFTEWIGEARKSISVDLIAGLTLWAMIVPEAVAYSNMASAPTSAAGLYGIIIVLPIYALFASSRYLVATSTAAVSVTTASVIALLSSDNAAGSFATLIMMAAVVYLLFWYFRLGFIADFISEPVSRGFMLGLAAFIVVGQLPKVLGIEKGKGNTFEQAWSLIENISQTNLAALVTALLVLVVLAGAERINKRIPGGLIALVLSMAIYAAFSLGDKYGVDMVGALPSGLPSPVMPDITLADLPIMMLAAVGLVVVAMAESTVLASNLAMEHDQDLDVDQQFLAFGVGNLFGGLFGGLLGCGSASSTMVNHDAGAKTLISTMWAAAATLVTVLLFTGLFAYLPEAFLGILIMHAVWHLLKLRGILQVRKYSSGEFLLAATALFGVLLFDVLYGLIIAMALNVLYFAYITSQVKVAEFGMLNDDRHTLVPMTVPGAEKLPEGSLAMGVTHGLMFYASAQSIVNQYSDIIKQHPEAKNVVFSFERMTKFDFTSYKIICEFEKVMRKMGKKIYLTHILDPQVMQELKDAGFDPDFVDISVVLDVTKLK